MVSNPTPGVRRARTLARLVGAVVGMVAGVLYGSLLVKDSGGMLLSNRGVGLAALLATGVAGSAAMALAAPLLTVDPFLWLEHVLDDAPVSELIGALGGAIVGLLISALVAVLLSPLPWGLGFIVSVSFAICLVYVGVRTGTRRRDAFAEVLRRRASQGSVVEELGPQDGAPIVLDTSVLIDGRITDVAASGFIQGRLLIAAFVLEELQRVADSADPLRRSRGRRGLAVVDVLKREAHVTCEITDLDFPGTPEVDSRLIKLARARGALLMTNDFNLNRLATVEGVRVLNLNDLANALKPIVSSGESLELTIVKEGKEPNQGVGYLDDGTRVVVEGGSAQIEHQVTATVTSVLQTAAGRMIFAALAGDGARPANGKPRPAPRPARVANR
jgi:uncharacterized protein YacL